MPTAAVMPTATTVGCMVPKYSAWCGVGVEMEGGCGCGGWVCGGVVVVGAAWLRRTAFVWQAAGRGTLKGTRFLKVMISAPRK